MFILLSIKAQGSGTFLIVQIAIIIIAVIGPMFILTGISSFIQEQISIVIGIKLTGNLISLVQNSLYAMPSGVTDVRVGLPGSCITDKCLDCGVAFDPLTVQLYPVIPLLMVYCDCDNYHADGRPKREDNQVITEVTANERGLVCDGMWIKRIEPVMIYRNPDTDSPGSYGVKFTFRPHPENDFYWNPVLVLGKGSFYRGASDYEAFSELYLDLNDFEAVRRALVVPKSVMPDTFNLYEGNLTFYSSTYWNHVSTAEFKDSLREGLGGLLSELFKSCDNGWGDVLYDEIPYWNNLSDNFTVILPSGYRIIKRSETVLCEEYCPGLHSLSSDACPDDGWIRDICYDLKDISKLECDEESNESCCADYEFMIGGMCVEGSCTGRVNDTNINSFLLLYNSFYPETDIDITLELETDDELCYPGVGEDCDYYHLTEEDIQGKMDYYTQRGGYCTSPACQEINYFPFDSVLWGPGFSKDCMITFYCAEDSSVGFIVTTDSDDRPCDMEGLTRMIPFPEGLNVTFYDKDSSLFSSLFRQEFPTEQEYNFNVIYGSPYESNDFDGCDGVRIQGMVTGHMSSFKGNAFESLNEGMGLDYLLNCNLSFNEGGYRIDLSMGNVTLYNDFGLGGYQRFE